MNYKEMDKKTLCDYLISVIDDKTYEKIEPLVSDEEFLDFLFNLKNDKEIQYVVRQRLAFFYTYLIKFRNMLKLKDILDNPNNHDVIERSDVINQIFFRSNTAGTDLFNPNFKYHLKRLRKLYNQTRGVNVSKEDYPVVKKICKEILNIYSKEKDMDMVCYYIYTNKYYPINKIIKDLNNFYFNSIVNDDTIEVYNDFSVEDIILLDDIVSYMSYDFFKKFRGISVDNGKYGIESVSAFIKLIHELELKYNNDYYEIAYSLSHDYNINITKLNNELTYLFENYRYNYFKEYSIDDENIEVFKNIFSFYKIKETYNSLTSKGLNFSKILLSDNPKKDRIIEISYYLLFFNRIHPYANEASINNKENLYPTEEGRKKFLEYYKGYEEYYEKNKYIIEEERQKEQEKQEEIKRKIELGNLEKYEKIIMAYVNSEELSILEFCAANALTENEFKYMISILEKNESEVFKVYENYVKNKNSRQYAIIMKKLNKMLKNLVEQKDKYNLLDYYTDTNFTIDEAFKILKPTMTPEQRRLFMMFKNKYRNDQNLGVTGIDNFINNYNVSYCLEKDEKGNIVKTYEVTKEEKQQVIILLKEKNIPITRNTCNLMLKKYFEEFIKPGLNEKAKRIDLN